MEGSECKGRGLQLCHVEFVELGQFLVELHLLEALELAVAGRADVEDCLYFHLPLPLLCQQLGLPSLGLLLIHFLRSWLVLLELLLPFFLELLHGDRGPRFLLFNLSLALPMVVVVLLMRPILALLLSLDCLIRQRLHVIILRLVPRVHHCQFLTIYLEIRVVGLSEGSGRIFRREELDKGEILESASQFVLDLPYISHWHERFKYL